MTELTDTPADSSDSAEAPHCLSCMEIWGGNTAVSTSATMPGIDIGVYSRPAAGDPFGGDMYYLSNCGAGAIGRIVVADMCGHGEAVAPASRVLRDLMRRHINTPDQSRLARALSDEILSQSVGRTGFATAVLATYYAPSSHLILVNAGHPPPLIHRAADGTWDTIEPDRCDIDAGQSLRNLPLGIVDGTLYEQFAVRLGPDDTVVFYTDSLPEAGRPGGGMLGVDGLLEAARRLDPRRAHAAGERPGEHARRLAERLVHEVDRVSSPGELEKDDTTVIVLDHQRPNPPAPSAAKRLMGLARMLGLGRLDTGPGFG